jgi:hypothetical protein
MPGIHPTSARQVRFAFAAERRGEMPPGTARRWAHRLRCFNLARKGKMPTECRAALRILERARG